MSKKFAVIDGANVAYEEKSKKGKPKVSNILAVRAALEKKGYESLVVADASLVYEIDHRQQLEALIDRQVVRQVPAETDADYSIIETAEKASGLAISNDEYEPYLQNRAWLK